MSRTLEEIQDELLDQVHAGEAIDRGALLAAHPDHAADLGAFLGLLDVVEGTGGSDGLVPGSLGEYRIVREVGRGGMGIVYEAAQTSLKRHVALKVLPVGLRMDARLVRRFRREAGLAAFKKAFGIRSSEQWGELDHAFQAYVNDHQMKLKP